MTRLPVVLFFVVLAFLSWGVYGPVLHQGQHDLGDGLAPSSLRPFVCVGIAYFLIAVVVPLVLLRINREVGHWSVRGAIWSFAAGAAGAIGALGVILAFKAGGRPVYVMPLVFGLAPVVNTFATMAMARTYRQAGTAFYTAVVVVALGAAGVLFFKPTARNVQIEESSDGGIKVVLREIQENKENEQTWMAASAEELRKQAPKAFRLYEKYRSRSLFQYLLVFLAIGLTALTWGSYGPLLHAGQTKMGGSRLRPFLCVGLAYFAIAVLAPLVLMIPIEEPGGWTISGTIWSLAAGAAGAIGALGIIMAFDFGGKPIFVMPVVFGGAPVVNTFTTILWERTYSELRWPFFISLALVVGGAVGVLVCAPRAHPRRGAEEDQQEPVADELLQAEPQQAATAPAATEEPPCDPEQSDEPPP